ncbi:MAG: hypothetical protein JWQ71_4367 [Pedosphaera sp.]|nr:hypothetical protein [Pedosphaera sp.]
MKNMIASAGIITLGAVGVQTADAQFLAAGAEKPWSVSGTLRGFYDDNYNTQPDGPSRVDSFGFEIRPAATLNLSLPQTTLSLSYVYDMKYYDDRPRNKADHSHDFEVFVNHNFSPRYSLDFTDSFVIAQEPEVLDRTLSTPLRSNGNNIRNNGVFNFHAEMTELLGFVFGYSNSFFDYEENAGNLPLGNPGPSRSALLDRIEHLVTLNSRWHVRPETTGILGYQFGAVDYISNESIGSTPPIFVPPATIIPGRPIAASTRNNYSHYLYIGVDHNFRRDLIASAKVGGQYTDYYNDPTGKTSLNPYADLSLSYSYMDGGTLVVGFRHSRNPTDVATPSANEVTQDQESSALYGTIVQKITPKLTGTLTGQFQYSTFNGGAANNQSDTIYLLGVNLAYQFTHYLSAELGYNYDKLDSAIGARTFDRNRVYLGVTASY